MNISESLKSKAGPLPVWAWGLIIGVIIVAGMYWRSSRSAIVNASSDEGALVAYPDLDGSSGGASGVPSVVDASGNSASTTPQFSGNLAWMTYVVAALVKEGNSPLTVQAALSKYLAGKELTAAEQAIVNQAIGRYGLPPNGVDGIPVISPIVDAVTPVSNVGVQVLPTTPSGTQYQTPFVNLVTTKDTGSVIGSSQTTWKNADGSSAGSGGYTFDYSASVPTSFLKAELAASQAGGDYGGKAAKEAALKAALALRGVSA